MSIISEAPFFFLFYSLIVSLLKFGDIFALKAFIEGIIKGSPQDNKEERKRKLIEILQKKADNSKPKRTYTKLNSGKTPARPKKHAGFFLA